MMNSKSTLDKVESGGLGFALLGASANGNGFLHADFLAA
jgi:hypothetical protein